MALVVGRLAPSPTGDLHLGHARTFLLAWLSVRSQGGQLVLRIEDLDSARCRPQYVDACLRDLEWLGIDWDIGPRLQSAGLARIVAAAHGLLKDGRAYPCVCSRRDVQASQSAPNRGDQELHYPGTCRARFHDLAAANRHSGNSACVRFRVAPGLVLVNDAVCGRRAFDVAGDVGDFPILRRDQSPAYQLAVVADDLHDRVTEVLRGDDLLPSAARQQLLYEALGAPPPRWLHVPLVVDSEGFRLAKRSDAVSLAQLRQRGVSAHDILAWVARSIGIDSREIHTAHDLIGSFRLNQLPTQPVRVLDSPLPPRGKQ